MMMDGIKYDDVHLYYLLTLDDIDDVVWIWKRMDVTSAIIDTMTMIMIWRSSIVIDMVLLRHDPIKND